MPGADDNPFALLGLPVNLDLDTDAILNAFRAQVRELHPDGVSTSGSPEYQKLVAARALLLNPIDRIKVAFAHGIGVVLNPSPRVEPSLLQEFFERHEQAEELVRKGDRAAQEQAAASAREEAEQLIAEACSAYRDEDVMLAETVLVRHRYVERLIELLAPETDTETREAPGAAKDGAPPGMRRIS